MCGSKPNTNENFSVGNLPEPTGTNQFVFWNTIIMGILKYFWTYSDVLREVIPCCLESELVQLSLYSGKWFNSSLLVWKIYMLKSYLPKVMVLEGEVLGRHLVHEGGGSVNGINALRKDTPQSSQAPSIMGGYRLRTKKWTPPSECNPAGALALDIPVSRAVRSKFLLFLQATPSVVFCYSSLNRVR